MTIRLVIALTTLALAGLVADDMVPHPGPWNFTCLVDLNEIGDFHTPKGGYVPITVRNGMLADIDLSPNPDYPVGTSHLRSVKDLEITHTVEAGLIRAKASITYTPPKREEMDLTFRAFVGSGGFTFKGTETKRRYGVYSSISDPEVQLLEEEVTTFFFNGSAKEWKNGDLLFQGPYRRVTRKRRYTGSTGWRESAPRITESIRTKRLEPIEVSAPEESPAWYEGAFLKAFGTPNEQIKADLKQVDARFSSIADTVQNENPDLARKQIGQLARMLEDLRSEIHQGAYAITVDVFRLPTGESLDQIRELQRLELELQELHQQAYGHVDQLIQDIEKAKHNFSGNVMKGLFRSYISWSGALPTDPVEGIAGYSLTTNLFHLPRSLMGMLDSAEKDSDFLASQVNAIRTMEALQAFWEEVRDHAVAEHRRLETHLQHRTAEAVVDLHEYAERLLR